jgi:hypothetical protein
MISLFLASILCVGAPVSMEEKSSNPTSSMVHGASHSFQLGTEVIQTIRESYTGGSYSKFLEKMDSDYAAAKKESALEGLIEIRKEGARAQIHPEFARSYRVIQDAKNQQLLEAVKGASDSTFVQKVQSAASGAPALDETILAICGKAPGSGKNDDENRLIDIDLEYYYKGIHLDSSNASDRREKHMVLEMEKADLMLKASKNFEDKTLKAAVEKNRASLDERLARNYDMMDLNDLARGKIKPTTPAEKEAAMAVSRAQGALADLHRHLLDSLDEHGQTAQ